MPFTVTYNKIPALRRNLRPLLAKIVRETAGEIQDAAKAFAPVDTSSLQKSIYAITGEGSDYELSAASAQSVNRDVEILPEAAAPPGLQAVVGVAAGHGVTQELGSATHGPQPFLIPAVMLAAGPFRSSVAKSVREAANG